MKSSSSPSGLMPALPVSGRSSTSRASTRGVHHYLRSAEACVLNGQSVARIALKLKNSGFTPDVMLAHNGWGEPWYLKNVFPQVPLISYFEFFYKRFGADIGIDPNEALGFDAAPRVRTKNVGNLLGLDAADLGQCPTSGKSRYIPSATNQCCTSRTRVSIPALFVPTRKRVFLFLARI
jgi:hypothetical protein